MAVLRLISALCAIAAMTTCVWAGDPGVGSLLVGKQVLAVEDVRQLTLRADGKAKGVSISPDGKYVAYLAENQTGIELRLSKTLTGKTVTILRQPTTDAIVQDGRPPSGIVWMLNCPDKGASQRWLSAEELSVAWSPDSKSFAFLAVRVELGKGPVSEWPLYALVYSTAGAHKASLPLPEAAEVLDKLLFTPDSTRLVMNMVLNVGLETGTISERKPVIQLVEIATGASTDIYSSNASLVGWSKSGALMCVVYTDNGKQLHAIALDGSSDQMIVENCAEASLCSPDGTLAVAGHSGLAVKNQLTARQDELTTNSAVSFQAWAPNGNMLLYSKSESICDAAKSKKREFNSLWLSGLVPGKLDALCVALDAEDKPSCSLDCRRIAYVSQGQLYVAELALRAPSVTEKLAAGIPLTEEETRSILMQNGKEIVLAIKM